MKFVTLYAKWKRKMKKFGYTDNETTEVDFWGWIAEKIDEMEKPEA